MVYKQIQQGIAGALHGLLPYTCVLCGAAGSNKRDLCEACEQEFPYITSACARCGISLPSAGAQSVCGQCLKKPPHYHKAISLFKYETPISWLIQGLKFNAKFQYGRVLSHLLTRQLADYLASEKGIKPELIIPVPLHNNRLKTRGFNQALEIAMPLAKSLGIPLDKDSVQRVIDTPSQSDLPAKKRVANIRKAFQVVKPIPYQSIALVDDVMTTGATVNELAKVLLKNGAKTVQVWTVARTHRS